VIGRFTEKPGLVEKRYKHFRCNATSYVLETPSVEFVPGPDSSVPEIVEGPRRRIGPLRAVFSVHVTGLFKMIARQVG
jgi:hypothetical protein